MGLCWRGFCTWQGLCEIFKMNSFVYCRAEEKKHLFWFVWQGLCMIELCRVTLGMPVYSP